MSAEVADRDQRQVWPAILNGMKCRCPRCGEGKIFRSYLKVKDTCDNCGQELFHHQADDGPPYIAIMIVGHLLVGIMLHLELSGARVNPMMYLYTMLPLAVLLPMAMLPSIKGGLIGYQWAMRMHGFDPGHGDPAVPEEIDRGV